jgi:hypothetical protein
MKIVILAAGKSKGVQATEDRVHGEMLIKRGINLQLADLLTFALYFF